MDIAEMYYRLRSLRRMLPALGLLFFFGSCSGDHSGHEDHDHEPHAHQPSKVADHDDEGLIVLSSEQLKTLGVEAETVVRGEFSEVVKVSGEISAMPGSEGAVAARQAGIVKLASGISAGMSVNAGRTIATVTARGMSGGDPVSYTHLTLPTT